MKTIFLSQIETVPHLIQYLSECSNEELKSVYKLLAIPESEFDPYLFWSDDCYVRNCIVRTDDYELILLCWEKDHYTPIHAHNDQECWVYNVKGEFEEIRFSKNGEEAPSQISKEMLSVKDQSYMNDDLGLHVLRNCSDGRAMSLHLYAKPIEQCVIYNPLTSQFETKTLTYHSLEGKLVSPIEI